MIIDTQNIIHPDLQPPEKLLKDMDRAGVDMALVYCHKSRFYDNDYTAAAVGQHPDRFFGMSFINPTLDNARFELSRARDLGMKGIVLDPKYDGYSMSIASHAFMDPVYRTCLEDDLVVLAEGWGDSHNTMPYQFRDVAWHFPALKIILGHMSMMGGYDDVHRVVKLCPNVYVNTATTTSSQVMYAQTIAGAEKVLLASFTPEEYLEVGLKKVEIAVPDEAARALILEKNARQLFGLEKD